MPYISESGIAQHSNQHPYIHDGHLLRLSFSEYVPNWQKIGSLSFNGNGGYTRMGTQAQFGIASGANTTAPSDLYLNNCGMAGSVYNRTTDFVSIAGDNAGSPGREGIIKDGVFADNRSMSQNCPSYGQHQVNWQNLKFQLAMPTYRGIYSANTVNQDPYPFIRDLMTTYSSYFFKDGVGTTTAETIEKWFMCGNNRGKLLYAPQGWSLSPNAKMVITGLKTWIADNDINNIGYVYLSANNFSGGYLASFTDSTGNTIDWTKFPKIGMETGAGHVWSAYDKLPWEPSATPSAWHNIEFTNCKPSLNIGMVADASQIGYDSWTTNTYTTWGADFYIDTV